MIKKLLFFSLLVFLFIGCNQQLSKGTKVKKQTQKVPQLQKTSQPQETPQSQGTFQLKKEIPSPQRTVQTAKILIIADFDSGKKPNNIGGDFGAWIKDPNDLSMSCYESFSKETRTGKGFSLRCDYDVNSPNPAYGGLWFKLNGIDISGYNKLTFWVKGDEKRGFTPIFKIELKNNIKEVGRFYVTGVNEKWQKIEVPLMKFAGISRFNNMTEFVVVFEDWRCPVKEGTLYFDDIAVEK
jgi:hypothetical protein